MESLRDKHNLTRKPSEMSQLSSKRQHLVESIKQTINKPPPVAVKNQGGSKGYATKPSYSSYLNTAIDYSKDHSVTPYLYPQNRQQQIYNVDFSEPSHTSEDSQRQQDMMIDQQYDDEIMNEIEMEIYSSAKRKQSQNNITQEEYEEEFVDYNELQPKKVATANTAKGWSSNNVSVVVTGREKRKAITTYNVLDENEYGDQVDDHSRQQQVKKYLIPQKPARKSVLCNNYYNQQTKILQEGYQQPAISPQKKESLKPIYEANNSQPMKKIHLHTLSNVEKPKKFLKFSINIKLFNANLDIKRVIKCVVDGSTKKRQDAKYLVELNNDQKEQRIVGNTEMIYFYKDALIDYYQALHFS